ncbi:rRNA pseudouridine synthase [Candidatus Woesearchaeota archaeon]|nr:rRNA pseudouridine synthase [Candidatus Woesearchaeota archaeon]
MHKDNNNKTLHRVQKLLSNYGYCSRRKAEELIEKGHVKVNGKIISLGDKATESDMITVDNKPIKPQKNIYLMLHKPVGCVTALSDRFQKTVMEYIKLRERIFPVGRLDFNTSGLLLFTNDGDFANNIMHPRYEINKTYYVKLNKPLAKEDLPKIESGVKLEDAKTSPAKINILSSKELEITIHEGRNRIVRRIFKKLGYSVTELKRTSIGHLNLGNLKPGESRHLSERDIRKIFQN